MNCKQGDLAIFVRTNYRVNKRYLGSVVRCVKPLRHPRTGEDGWQITPAIGEWTAIADRCLQPIRPGDESIDEVRELHAPQLLEVA